MNRSFDPEVIEEESRTVLETLCSHTGMKAMVNISARPIRKKQLRGFIVYADGFCERASEMLSKGHPAKAEKRSEVIARQHSISTAQYILQDLDSMLKEQDEPDFRNRPTEYAYQLARGLIKKSYTHYIGTSPTPAISPDGEGGLVVEWKRDKLIVRLVISAAQEGKSYVYSRGPDRSLVERSISGLVLAQQLSTIFAD
jgi:hypothetical protein